MKMAAAEGLFQTEKPASFSIFTVGTPDGTEEKFAIKIPGLLSFLGTGSFDGEVKGIDELREEYAATYGQDPGAAYYTAGDYVPVVPITYWSFRFMIGLGMAAAAGAALVLWLTRRGRVPSGRWFPWLARRAAGAGRGRQLVRLDLHRDGPPAVGRLRPDDHRARRVAQRQRLRGGHLAGRADPAVRRAGGRRARPAPALRRRRARTPSRSRRTSPSAGTTTTPRSPSPTDARRRQGSTWNSPPSGSA